MENDVFTTIRDYLADAFDVNPDDVTLESDIVNDFDADSLDIIDMITVLSDEFGIEISDEAVAEMHTVGDVVSYIEAHV